MEFTEADFTENHDWIKQQLKREMYITAFSVDESQRVAIEQDPEIQKAMEAMPKAQALLDNAKKLMVQRMTQQDRARLKRRFAAHHRLPSSTPADSIAI